MTSTMKIRLLSSTVRWAVILVLLTCALEMQAQAPKPFQGTITAINGSTLSVKSDADGVQQVDVPATAILLRIAPGAKDLSAAEKITFNDLAVGDRALVKPDPNGTASTLLALRIIAIKQSDLAQKQQKDREDWQRRGVGGLVKSVDPATGVIMVGSGAGATAKTITVHTTQDDNSQALRSGFGQLRRSTARANRCNSRRRSVARTRREECGWNGDSRRRGDLRQLPQHRWNHYLAGCGCFHADRQGSGHQKTSHHPRNRRIATAAVARSHGCFSGHAPERNPERIQWQRFTGKWHRSRRTAQRRAKRRPMGRRGRSTPRSAADAQPRAGDSACRFAKGRSGHAGGRQWRYSNYGYNSSCRCRAAAGGTRGKPGSALQLEHERRSKRGGSGCSINEDNHINQ